MLVELALVVCSGNVVEALTGSIELPLEVGLEPSARDAEVFPIFSVLKELSVLTVGLVLV